MGELIIATVIGGVIFVSALVGVLVMEKDIKNLVQEKMDGKDKEEAKDESQSIDVK